MPSFRDSIIAAAPPEEVWKILYDPARFPEWLAGVETVEPGAESADPDAAIGFTIYTARRPDFPLPHRLQAVSEGRRVVISCLNTDLLSVWQLEPLEDGTVTRISVQVDIPASRGPLRRHRARCHRRFPQPPRNTCVQHQPVKLTNTHRGMAFIPLRRRDRIVTAPLSSEQNRWPSARIR